MFFIDVQIFLQSFHRGCKRHAAAVREFPMTALRHDCPCRFAAAVYEGVRTALAVIQVFVRMVVARHIGRNLKAFFNDFGRVLRVNVIVFRQVDFIVVRETGDCKFNGVKERARVVQLGSEHFGWVNERNQEVVCCVAHVVGNDVNVVFLEPV